MLQQVISFISQAGAISLALVPAMLNLAMLIYALTRLPRNALTYTFALTVFGLFGWQCTDALMRMIEDPEIAQTWHDALWPLVLLVTSAGLHFSLLFTGYLRKRKDQLIPVLIYAPMIIYDLFNRVGVSEIPIEYDPTWGFVQGTDFGLIGLLQVVHASVYAILILGVLWFYRSRLDNQPVRKQQTTWILIGFLIPTAQGVVTQVIMPHVLGLNDIPLTSFFMSGFTISIFVALRRHQLFGFEPRYAADQILSNMNDGVCVVDAHNYVRFANNRFCEITGLQRSELTDQKLFDVVIPEESAEIDRIYLNRSMEQGGVYRIRFTSKAGRTVPSYWLEAPLKLSSQGLAGWIITVTDISLLKNTEEQLRQKNKELSTFLYRSSHDLRGPLSSIMGLINMLKSPGEIHDQVVGMLETSSQKLDGILNELIGVAVIQEEDPKVETINILDLVQSILSELDGHKDDTLTIELEIPSGTVIHTSRELMKTILRNLIENAMTYRAGEGGPHRVVIRVVPGRKEWIVEVEDNGSGIPQNHQDHIFDMFYRADKNSTGSGLGLYIVKTAVEKLGGAVQCGSQPREGAVFTVRIPALGEHDPGSASSPILRS